jgi:3-oxoadipate enol-lactonase
MPFAAVNGIELYYEVHGSGPAVLFAHGQGGNHLSWWQQVPYFAPHYTCITFDHRAFGQSVDIDNRGRTSFGADAMALLDHLDINDVRIVAHSMGGRSAVALALRDPKQRLRAMVIGGNSAGLGDEAVRERREEAASARGDRGLGAFSVAPGYAEANPESYFLLRQVSRMNPSRPKDFLSAPRIGTTTPAPRGDNHERLASTGIPALFIVGEHDAITPPDMIEMCSKLVPGSRFYEVMGSGHSAYWEKPDEFNQVVLSFLESVDGAGSSK